MYADFVCAREGHAQDLKPKDPRTEEDKMASIELLKANKEKIKQGKELSFSEQVARYPYYILVLPSDFQGLSGKYTLMVAENNIGDIKNVCKYVDFYVDFE